MKRSFLLLSLLALLLTGCSGKDYEDLERAVAETEAQSHYDSRLDVRVNLELAADNDWPEEAVEELRRFKTIRVEQTGKLRGEKRSDQYYLEIGGVGISLTYHETADGAYLGIPLIGRYMAFDALSSTGIAGEIDWGEAEEYLERFEGIEDPETLLVTRREALTIGETTLRTDRYDLSVDPASLERAIRESALATVEADERATLEEALADLEILSGAVTYWVDADGRIVREEMESQVRFGELTTSVAYTLENGNFGTEEALELPVVTADLLIEPDELADEAPNLMRIFEGGNGS
jgi:hypothetical protein